MLSKWLFTTAVAVSSLAVAVAQPQGKLDLDASGPTINLLKDGLPPYDKSKDTDGLLKATYDAVEKLIKDEKKNTGKATGGKKGCDLTKVKIRPEWNALSNKAKKKYTAAINCLHSKPSRYDPVEVPGAKTRYDDFVAVHIIQTQRIHATANFLHWHRYFLYLFEAALKEECGYNGPFPYWHWPISANKPYPSHVFNDGEFGLSGDGEYVPHNLNGTPLGGGLIMMPMEPNGGGCVTTGPFANFTVNLGPIIPTLDLVPPVTVGGKSAVAHNPRCLRRAISAHAAKTWTTTPNVLDLLFNPAYSSIGPFQARLQGDFPGGHAGLHAGGHFTIGGDPGGDLYSAPGDPAFWVHHTQVDRIWWLWQLLDPSGARFNQVAGTLTMLNNPPSRNGTLEDIIEMGAVSDVTYKMKELISTTDGPLCYIYL
ncbi:Di-copper centre-containing protein [Ascobolus immersus RN42]|uniref:Di-copper centre-containing protein n=1 Tax=Ascobolus immersus RN42 TaxID=1160509 RepID=A0A3N4IEP2_ASCIM|nr:Di-copper centre-containing protein [Ascobolus immersus RN42]